MTLLLNQLYEINPSQSKVDDLLECFLSGRNQKTLEAYRTDLEDFRKTIGSESIKSAITAFISLNPGDANGLVLRYRNALVERGLQSSTINRRLAALRSLVKLARTLGVVTWSIEIPNLKVETYRDTRGPGLSSYCLMLELAGNQQESKARRDVAILRLLFDLALRASELTSIDLGDFDPARSSVAVSAKGKSQKVILSVPEASRVAILSWIEVRGVEPGPLFYNFDRAKKGQRLSRNGLYELVRKFGEDVGIKTRTHGIRHLSITESCKVAQANGFGLEEVLDHSRHASVATLMLYRDRERDVQGQIASLISAKLDRTKG